VTQLEQDVHLITISRLRDHDGLGVSEIAFRGAVRQRTLASFQEYLRRAGERSRYLLVEMAELDYVSSEALGWLLDQSRRQEQMGGWLRIVSPSEAAGMILRLSGVADVLGVYPDAASALADTSSRAA